MLDFKEELSKYKPVLEVAEIEQSLQGDDMKDVMDLLNHLKAVPKEV
ncbi:hypothetical protein AGMMS49975_10550 [Clostridia bacterium]|nr:hypothetical protein AGMMS49975_10550 [Clostridia bacterium]